MKQAFSKRDWRKKKTRLERMVDFFGEKKEDCIEFFVHSYTFLKNKLPNQKTTKTTHQKTNYPHRNTSPNQKRNMPKKQNSWKTRLKKWSLLGFKIGVILSIIGLIALVGIFIYFSKDLPEPGKVNSRFIAESTKIYDRTGTVLLYDIHGEEKRTLIDGNQIPDTIRHATIALEDQDFYDHHGIKIKAIFRAFLSQAFGVGVKSGGSTITQQLVKNSILTSERSIVRKIKEAILAVELELKFSKDEILNMYLNEIPYGSNAYGIEAAAQTFFNKKAVDLTYDEAAILASLPQAPSRYSPYGSSTERLIGRQKHAINQIAELGFITAEEATTLKEIDVLSKIARNTEKFKAAHFVFYVREYLEEKYGSDYLQENGLKVVTTLDWDKQQIAERIVKEKAFINLEKYKAENAALVAINPKNGEILTMVGSRDYFDEEIDGKVNVAVSERQPGSSFKPYAYLLSFVKGYTPETIVYDVQTEFKTDLKPYIPQNYDGTFRGPVKLKDALAMSLNIPAVKMLYLADQKETISFAKELGITTLNSPERYGLALVLGGGEVKLLDHTAAFSVFANNGVKNSKEAILKITDKNGIVLEEADHTQGSRIVEEEFITMLSHVLSTNAYRVPAFGSNNPLRFDDRPVAAKTGTTNENRDAWTVGYTPRVAVGVWAGNNDNSRMNSGGVGANAAAPIFRDFILEAYPDIPSETFSEYKAKEFETEKDIIDGDLPEMDKIDVCLISKTKQTYCKENKYCPDDRKKERRFADIHNILHYVQKDDPRGDEPKKPETDPQYDSWEKGIEEYYKNQEDSKIIFGDEPDDCEEDDFDDYKPKISVSVSVDGKNIKIKVDDDSPFDLDKIVYEVEGKTVHSSKNDSYTYEAKDDENGKTLDIKVTLHDEIGNTVSDSTDAKPSF